MQREQQLQTQLRDIITFSNKFEFSKTDLHTSLLVTRSHTYMIKNMAVVDDDKKDLPAILQTLAMHQNLNRKYLLTLLHYQIYRGLDDAQYIKAIYQYGNVSLKQQIQNRLTLGSPFQEDQLWAIFAMVVKALFHLQQRGIIYGVLGTDKIFVNQTVKLLDPSATATDPLLISQGRLYSPQIISDKQEIDMFKSDVYVLALLIIQCALLVDLSKQVQPDLQKYLQEFEKLYSNQFLKLLQQMLSLQPQQRPSFLQLRDYLVQQMQLNTTKCNEPMTACLADQQNQPTSMYMVHQQQQQINDILYQSYSCQNSRNQSFSSVSNTISDLQYSDYQKAHKKYMATRNTIVQQLSSGIKYWNNNNNNGNNNIMNNNGKRAASPLSSTRNNSRIIVAQKQCSNNNNKFKKTYGYHQHDKQNCQTVTRSRDMVETRRVNDCANNDNNNNSNCGSNCNRVNISTHNHNQPEKKMIRHKYSKSTDNFTIQTPQCQPIQHTQHRHTAKQRTKQIKHRLVKNIRQSQRIQQQLVEQEQQNSNLFSNSFRNSSEIITKSDNNTTAITMNHNMVNPLIGTAKKAAILLKNYSGDISNNISNVGICATVGISQQLQHSIYKNSNDHNYAQQHSHSHSHSHSNSHSNSKSMSLTHSNQSSSNKLFTDPNLLRIIHEDLARMSSTRSSGLYGQEHNRWQQ